MTDTSTTRLTIDMSLKDMVIAMAEGNPGALSAMMQIVQAAEVTDPDSALGAFGPLLSLDTQGCYGSRIWTLYKDVCGQSAVSVIGVLRAVQLGLLIRDDLDSAIDRRTHIDVTDVIAKVREKLPNFAAM